MVFNDKSINETRRRIGIDFGTSNSKFAYWYLDSPKIIQDQEGDINVPSVVYFKNEDEILVGKDAKKNLILFPDRTIYSVKRKMGSKYWYQIDGQKYPPEYIGALIFQKLLSIAKMQTGFEFYEAAISVPANFSDGQRYAIKDAAEIAGLNVVRMINEPTAAALAYGLNKNEKKTVLVYDFGGGTFDVTVLTIDKDFFNIEASTGINKLGGDDIDEILVDHLKKIILKECKLDLKKDLKALQIVRLAAEAAKIELSSSKTALINIPFLNANSKGNPIAFTHELTRDTFNSLIKDIIEKTEKPIRDVLESSCLSLEDLDDIILVGGTTKIPAIQEFIKKLFGKSPLINLDPHAVIALGAAITTIEDIDIKENIKIPSIDISDVVPHSFGIRVFPNIVERIIEKNEKIPIMRSKIFTNIAPYTPELEVEVFQGENEITLKKNFLGAFFIDVAPKPSFKNKLEVNFELGKEFGILNVNAKDLDTGLERTVRIEAKGRLSNKEKMKWLKKTCKDNFLTVVVNNNSSKIETSLLINEKRTVADVLHHLLQKNFINSEKKDLYQLYYKNRLLKSEEMLSDLNIQTFARFQLRVSEL